MTVGVKVIDRYTLAEATFSCTREEFETCFAFDKSVKISSSYKTLFVPVRIDSVFDIVCPLTYDLFLCDAPLRMKFSVALGALILDITTLFFRCITLPFVLMKKKTLHPGIKLMHEKGVDPSFSPKIATIFEQVKDFPWVYKWRYSHFCFKPVFFLFAKTFIEYIYNKEAIRRIADAFRNMQKGLYRCESYFYHSILETQYPQSKTKIHREVYVDQDNDRLPWINTALKFEKLLIPIAYSYQRGGAHAICLHVDKKKREICLYDSGGGNCIKNYPEIAKMIEKVNRLYFSGQAIRKNYFKRHQTDPHSCARYQADFITYIMNGGTPEAYCNQEIDAPEIERRSREKAEFIERVVAKHMPCWKTDKFWIRSA